MASDRSASGVDRSGAVCYSNRCEGEPTHRVQFPASDRWYGICTDCADDWPVHYGTVLEGLTPETITTHPVATDGGEPQETGSEQREVCYNPLCEEELCSPVDEDVEGYCSWECAVMARDGHADRILREQDDGLRADGSGGTKYGDKLPEGGTADLYADDEGNGAAWREETSAVSIEIDVQLHDDGYQTDRKWTIHCTERIQEDTVIAGWGVEHQNKGNYWRRGDRWDDAVDFADLPFPVRRRVAAVLNRSLDEITPEHRRVHREDGTGLADEAGDRDE